MTERMHQVPAKGRLWDSWLVSQAARDELAARLDAWLTSDMIVLDKQKAGPVGPAVRASQNEHTTSAAER